MDKSFSSEDFYVVGVGASAGGLDALEKFFSHAPADSGLAIIIIQHLSPDYKSLMADLLSKRTDMPVHVAQDGMLVEPNNVYLIPPRHSLTIFHRKLHLAERESGQLYLPIDIFFQSLAEDMGERAIGVILSGTGSDGTRGIRAIKENGGLVMVQDEQSAKFDGMPRSAIATNLVDYVLPPEQMIREAFNYIQHPCLASDPIVKRAIAHDTDNLSKIFALLRNSSGVDFTHYKQSTLIRRIERRMGIKQLEKLSDYLHYLYQSAAEVNTLYREFLIGVTRFFRDRKVFEYLKHDLIPSVFATKKRGDPMRVWVAACSTGEEAYSIAILLTEYMETSGRHLDVKVFATDLDKNALEFAGRGVYPESIAADVSEEHLKNYFVKNGDSYTVTRRVREMVIFAQQNIITDPPFSKVDLISCRNVLIYFQPILQKKVVSAFQFALNPDGYLVLGTSETVGETDDYFVCRDTKAKVYQYKGGFRPSLNDSRLTRLPTSLPTTGNRYPASGREDWRVMDSIQRGLLETFLASVVVVDENLNLIYTVGNMDDYLQVPSGWVSTTNIIKQAREGLAIPLGTAIHKVLSDQTPITYKNISLGEGAYARTIDLVAKPFFEQGTRQKLVFIQLAPVQHQPSEVPESQTYDLTGNTQQRIKDLEHELQYTRESLQATVEELETSNEELQATNEELFAANEELQSTNEELHSVNEELITVNAEYHAKIQELTKLNEDINNLLSSTDVGTLFLDLELRIRLFTPPAQANFHLLAQDVGRPLRFVTHEIVGYDLNVEAEKIIQTLTPHEQEVQNTSGRWYQMRLAPYYTLHHHVGGVVVTFMDITDFKRANAQLMQLSAAVEQSPSSVIITNLKGTIEYVNPRFTQTTGYSAEEVLGKNPSMLQSGQTPAETYRQLWHSLAQGQAWHGEFANHRKNGEIYYEIASITPILDESGKPWRYLAIQEDITERKLAEAALRMSEERFRSLAAIAPIGIYLTDTAGQCVYANDRWLEIAGLSLAEALGDGWQKGLHPEDIETVFANWQKMIEARGRWGCEYRFKSPTGRITKVYGLASSILDGAGRISGYVGVNLDITNATGWIQSASHE